jgi:glutaredoxin 3
VNSGHHAIPPTRPSPLIEIYATGFCPYCVMARRLLKAKRVEWKEYRLDLQAELRDEMQARSHRRSVPQIFIGGQHIGGFDDLSALDRAGGLDALLGALPPAE